MEGITFEPGVIFKWNNKEYIIRKYLDLYNLEVSNLSYLNQIEVFSLYEILDAWYDNLLIIKDERINQEAKLKQHDFTLLSDSEKKIVNKRYQILEPYILGTLKPSEVDNYLQSLSTEDRKIIGSKSTFYRWVKRWNSTEDKRSLLSNNKFKGKYYNTNPIIISIIDDIVREEEKRGLKTTNREKWMKVNLKIKEYNEMRMDSDEKLNKISFTTLYRIVQDRINTFNINKSRIGKVQARLNERGVTTNVLTNRPLQRVEIDWTPIDLLIVDLHTLKRKRFYLVYAIDACTGYSLGFYLSAKEPDVNAIKQCLLHCMLPKVKLKELYPSLKNNWTAYGVPETIVLDNAKVNESRELEEICSLMGIEIQYVPVKSGHQKGKVERALQTINKLLHTMPGTTFSNPQEKSQYDAEGKAVVTLKKFYEILHIILVDVLAQDISLGVGGKPADLWEQSLLEQKVHRKLPYQMQHLKELLATGLEYRSIQNKGVEIQSQFFTSQELMDLRDLKLRKNDKRNVRIRFDRADMREVYVYDEYHKRYIKAYPTKNSLAMKKIDDKFPVHYEQLHAHSYNIESEYRNFDTTDIAISLNQISNLVHESKIRVQELEKLPISKRAEIYAQELADIESNYRIELGMEELGSIELISEIIPSRNKVNKKKTMRNQKVDGSNESVAETRQGLKTEIVNNLAAHELEDEEEEQLTVFESIIRVKH